MKRIALLLVTLLVLTGCPKKEDPPVVSVAVCKEQNPTNPNPEFIQCRDKDGKFTACPIVQADLDALPGCN